MELLIAVLIATLTGCGVYLMLRSRTFPVILGLTLLTYGVNLFVFVMGRLRSGEPPVVGAAATSTDPLPQALVLTSIVISFAMTAFLLVLALRARAELGNDHIDGNMDPGIDNHSHNDDHNNSLNNIVDNNNVEQEQR